MALVAEIDRMLEIQAARDRREFGPPAGETTAFESEESAFRRAVKREIDERGQAAVKAEDREVYEAGCDRPAGPTPTMSADEFRKMYPTGAEWVETSPQSGTTAPGAGMVWVSGHGWMTLEDARMLKTPLSRPPLPRPDPIPTPMGFMPPTPVAPPLPPGATFLTEWDRQVLNIVRTMRAVTQFRTSNLAELNTHLKIYDRLVQERGQTTDDLTRLDEQFAALLKS
jgi:hypothetical protein